MSTDRKIMKILAFCLFIWGVAALVFDVIGLVVLSEQGFTAPGVVMEVIFTVGWVFALQCGVKGVHGANTPSKSGKFITSCLVLFIVMAVFLVVCVAFTGAAVIGDGVAVVSGVGLVLAAAGWFYGRKVLEASKR
jgi:hypothetical protein